MANKIYIQDSQQKEDPWEFPVVDDVQLEVSSNFSSFANDVPGIASIVGFITTLSATGGKASTGLTNMQTLLHAPRWESTEPLRVTLKLAFFSQFDAKTDVYDKIMKLTEYTVLKFDRQTNRFSLPGISLAASKAWKTRTQQVQNNQLPQIAENARLVSVQVPGMFYIPLAMVEKAAPIFSKEKTMSGYPLWGMLDLTVRSTQPAHSEMFQDVGSLKLQKLSSSLSVPSIGGPF